MPHARPEISPFTRSGTGLQRPFHHREIRRRKRQVHDGGGVLRQAELVCVYKWLFLCISNCVLQISHFCHLVFEKFKVFRLVKCDFENLSTLNYYLLITRYLTSQSLKNIFRIQRYIRIRINWTNVMLVQRKNCYTRKFPYKFCVKTCYLINRQ